MIIRLVTMVRYGFDLPVEGDPRKTLHWRRRRGTNVALRATAHVS